MESFPREGTDAAVRRLTNGTCGVEADEFGVYLVHLATRERVRLLRSDRDPTTVDADRFARLSVLSQRERQVLSMLGDGRDMREIADRLAVSIKTVETFRSRVRQKLGLKKRTELLALAIEWKLERRKPAPADELIRTNGDGNDAFGVATSESRRKAPIRRT